MESKIKMKKKGQYQRQETIRDDSGRIDQDNRSGVRELTCTLTSLRTH